MGIDVKRLADFFPADAIEWKPITISKKTNKGLAAAYITNRAIMDRLDDACGPENWRNEFTVGPGGGILCGLSIRIGDEWVTKWDGAENTDIEPVKGGLSNAMRRAAVQWGIGRYLYDLPQQWVPVDERGRFVQPPRIPPQFLPQGAPVVDTQTGVVEEAREIVRNGAPLSEIEQILQDERWTDEDRAAARKKAQSIRSQRELAGYASHLRNVLEGRW